MPAAERYESPAAQLLRLAAAARREGVEFDDFWLQATRPGQPLVTRHKAAPPTDCIIWPRDTFDRRNAMEAILATESAWRRAYLREPPARGELAIQVLAPALSGLAASEMAGSACAAADLVAA